MITQEQLQNQVRYSPETGEFFWKEPIPAKARRNFGKAGTVHPDGYVRLRVLGSCYMAHRLAWLYIHGYYPSRLDHINRCKSDNRITNLRETTYRENQLNSDQRSEFGTGVYKTKSGKFYSQISDGGKLFHLGTFATKEEAANAYSVAVQQIESHGAILSTNA